MPSIFHYTDAVGLSGILSSGMLFATHYRFLNDTSEAGIIQELVVPIFEAEIREIAPKLRDKGLLKELEETHGTRIHRLLAEKFFSTLLRLVDNVSPFFVLSFCRHDEGSKEFAHGLLSQWRAYGEAGGFAIEFDEEGIDKLLETEMKTHVYAGWRSNDVRYENYDSLVSSEVFKGIAGELIRQLYKRDVSKITGRADIDTFMLKFMEVAPFMKHTGFREEGPQSQDGAARNCRRHVGSSSLCSMAIDRTQYTPNVGSLRTLMTRFSGAVERSEDRGRTKARPPDAVRHPWRGTRGR